MLEQILAFITPGPLNEIFGFRLRVFTSWITLGLALGLILSIRSLSSGAATTGDAATLVMYNLWGVSLVVCFLGFVGLGIDAVGGRRSEYPGWYWWLFPIVTYIFLGITLFVTIFALAFRINLPRPRIPQRKQPQFNPEQFRREVKERKVEDILKEFDKQFKQIEEGNQLKPEEKKVIKKLKSLDRAALRSRLKDALSNDEMEVFLRLILFLIGFEKR